MNSAPSVTQLEPRSPLRNGLNAWHAATLVLVSVVAVILAVTAFDRRDIVTG